MNPTSSTNETPIDDYYAVLGLDSTATENQVKAAYKKRLEQIQNGTSDYTTAYLQVVYETLLDRDKRWKYDKWLQEEKRKISGKKALNPQLIFILALLGGNLLIFFMAFIAEAPANMPLLYALGIFVLGIALIAQLVKQKNRDAAVKTAIVGLTMIATDMITYLNFHKQVLYIDNQTAIENVEVRIDGATATNVGAFHYQQVTIRKGKYTITAYKQPGDSLLETFEVNVDLNDPNLYNILSVGEYIDGTKSYSEDALLDWLNGKSGPDSPEGNLKERWISLKNYSYIFEMPPQSITVKKDLLDTDPAEATRSYIVRRNRVE
jgi:hypothetical protein